MTVDLIIGTREDQALAKEFESYRAITPPPASHIAMETQTKLLARYAGIVIDRIEEKDSNYTQVGAQMVSDAFPARHVLAGLRKNPKMAEYLKPPRRTDSGVSLQQRMTKDQDYWERFVAGIPKRPNRNSFDLFSVLGADSMSNSLPAILHCLNTLERYAKSTIITAADDQPSFYDIRFLGSRALELGKFKEFAELEEDAILDAIDFNSQLAWWTICVGILFVVFESVVEDGNVHEDWKCRGFDSGNYGLNQTRLSLLLYRARDLEGASVPEELDFPNLRELKESYKIPSQAIQTVLDEMETEGMIRREKCVLHQTHQSEYTINTLTPWGREEVSEVFLDIAKYYDKKTMAELPESLRQTLTDATTRNFYDNRRFLINKLSDRLRRDN